MLPPATPAQVKCLQGRFSWCPIERKLNIRHVTICRAGSCWWRDGGFRSMSCVLRSSVARDHKPPGNDDSVSEERVLRAPRFLLGTIECPQCSQCARDSPAEEGPKGAETPPGEHIARPVYAEIHPADTD